MQPDRQGAPLSRQFDDAQTHLVTEQAAPIANDRPAVWDLVMADMRARDQEGRRKYGVPLQPFNGRDTLVDAYQESLDLAVYVRSKIEEQLWERKMLGKAHAICVDNRNHGEDAFAEIAAILQQLLEKRSA